MSDRFARQRLLAEVGDAGQAAIGRATAMVVDRTAAGEVEARYLAAAGFGLLRVPTTAMARDARQAWPALVTAADAPPIDSPSTSLIEAIEALGLDPAARDVAVGAARALRQIHAALGAVER